MHLRLKWKGLPGHPWIGQAPKSETVSCLGLRANVLSGLHPPRKCDIQSEPRVSGLLPRDREQESLALLCHAIPCNRIPPFSCLAATESNLQERLISRLSIRESLVSSRLSIVI